MESELKKLFGGIANFIEAWLDHSPVSEEFHAKGTALVDTLKNTDPDALLQPHIDAYVANIAGRQDKIDVTGVDYGIVPGLTPGHLGGAALNPSQDVSGHVNLPYDTTGGGSVFISADTGTIGKSVAFDDGTGQTEGDDAPDLVPGGGTGGGGGASADFTPPQDVTPAPSSSEQAGEPLNSTATSSETLPDATGAETSSEPTPSSNASPVTDQTTGTDSKDTTPAPLTPTEPVSIPPETTPVAEQVTDPTPPQDLNADNVTPPTVAETKQPDAEAPVEGQPVTAVQTPDASLTQTNAPAAEPEVATPPSEPSQEVKDATPAPDANDIQF